MKKIRIIDQNVDIRYVNFFRSLYRNEKNIDYFMSDIEQSINYCVLDQKYLLTVVLESYDNLIGHCSLIKFKGSETDAVYFGFFESPSKEEDFNLLWSSVLAEARKKNIKKLVGPINGSIWFPYRFINFSNKRPFFKGELPTQSLYKKLFSSFDNCKIINYSSGLRNDFNQIIELTKNSFESLQNTEFYIETLTEINKETLLEIQVFSDSIFSKQSVAYEHFPVDYFFQLYNRDKTKDIFGVYIARKGKDIVGFCSIFFEDDNTLIFKTIAVDPLFQMQGIGSALVYMAHSDAKAKGIKNIIYALVRDDNNIKFFPKDRVSIIRTYSLFEFNI